MTRIEEDKKEQVYTDLKVVSSSLKTHKNELDKSRHKSGEWKYIWMNSTKAQKEMREEYETHIQGLEVEVQSLVNALREVRTQAMNEKQ